MPDPEEENGMSAKKVAEVRDDLLATINDVIKEMTEHYPDSVPLENGTCVKNILPELILADLKLDHAIEDRSDPWYYDKVTTIGCKLCTIPIYEDLVYSYEARKLTDTTLFILQDQLRQLTRGNAFTLSRTLLTSNRRRALARTMNAEPNIFVSGVNWNHSLGVKDCEKNHTVGLFTRISVPPVYELKTSGDHTVFWCHNGNFYGCGKAANLVVGSRKNPNFVKTPTQMNIKFLEDEDVIEFKTVPSGTIFVTKKRWYFLGDYPKSCLEVMLHIDAVFVPVDENSDKDTTNFWVCHKKPVGHPVMIPDVENRANYTPIQFYGNDISVRLFPTHWIELTTIHKHRVVCFLLDGIEVKNVHIQHFQKGNIWAVFDKTLYSGTVQLVLHKFANDNIKDLDNYIMLIDLKERRTPAPFVVTSVVSTEDSVFVKCGDFPFYGFDHLEFREEWNRYNVQKFHFDLVETYMKAVRTREETEESASKGTDYTDIMVEQYAEFSAEGVYDRQDEEEEDEASSSGEEQTDETRETSENFARNKVNERSQMILEEKLNPLMNKLIEEAEQILKWDKFFTPIETDNAGRVLPPFRYVNFFGFLYYISIPRLPSRCSKFDDPDVDSLLFSSHAVAKATHRMRRLFEEFEKINWPGTDVWKPTEFLRVTQPADKDFESEGQYRMRAATWCYTKFVQKLKFDWGNRKQRGEPVFKYIDVEIANLLLYIIRFTRELMLSAFKMPPDRLDVFKNIYPRFEDYVPDNKVIFITLCPKGVLTSRVEMGLVPRNMLIDTGGDHHFSVKMTLRLRHEDPRIKDTNFWIMTSRLFLANLNFNLVNHINDQNELCLNTFYPNDPKLHRLIAQTHFVGHGYTDLEAANLYQDELAALGWKICRVQKYMKRGVRRSRGYLVSTVEPPEWARLVDLDPNNEFAYSIKTADSDEPIICHQSLIDVFSLKRIEEFPPLNKDLLRKALRGLHDRTVFQGTLMQQRIDILNWYHDSQMPEAFLDLLRQCILDATTRDYKHIRYLIRTYSFVALRFIGEHRPGIILWHRSPLPVKCPELIKTIVNFWPKNEYFRTPRVPQEIIRKGNKWEDSLFHLIDIRQRRNLFTDYDGIISEQLQKYYKEDFPTDESFKPFKLSTGKQPVIRKIFEKKPEPKRRVMMGDYQNSAIMVKNEKKEKEKKEEEEKKKKEAEEERKRKPTREEVKEFVNRRLNRYFANSLVEFLTKEEFMKKMEEKGSRLYTDGEVTNEDEPVTRDNQVIMEVSTVGQIDTVVEDASPNPETGPGPSSS